MSSAANAAEPASGRPANLVAALLLGLWGIAILATWRDYGTIWDEQVQSTYGELVLAFFRSGLSDRRCLDYKNLYLYGPAFELLAALAYAAVPAAKFLLRHLLVALCGWLTGVAVWRLGRRLGGPWAGELALLALLLTPRFYGETFANSKDVPFACAFAWAMLALLRLCQTEEPRWRDWLWAGAGIGAALAIRTGGFLLLAFLGTGLGWRVCCAVPGSAWRRWPALAARLAATVALAWGLMVLVWPWAWGNPWLRPLAAFREAASFSAVYPVLFLGEVVPSNALPRWYLPSYLVFTTPLPLLALAGLGLAGWLRRAWQQRCRGAAAGLGLAMLWLVFPVAYAVVRHPNVYDGLRHFLFLLPGLALAAGCGGAALAGLVPAAGPPPAARRAFARLLGALVVLALLVPLPAMWRLHPYQYCYFTALDGSWLAFDTDYWATSYKEAAVWLNARAQGRPTIVVVAANDNCLPCFSAYAAPNLEVHRVWNAQDPLPPRFDYYVGMTRYGLHQLGASLPVVHRVGRAGNTYCVIKSGPPPPNP